MMISNGKFNIHNLNCQGNSLTYHCLSDQLEVFLYIWGKDSSDKVYNEIFNTLVAKSTFSHVVKFTQVQTERCGCWSNGCSHPRSFHFNDELNFSLNQGSNEAPFYFCEINKQVVLLEMDKVVSIPPGPAPNFFSLKLTSFVLLFEYMSVLLIDFHCLLSWNRNGYHRSNFVYLYCTITTSMSNWMVFRRQWALSILSEWLFVSRWYCQDYQSTRILYEWRDHWYGLLP